ncbi:MAG: hypothetical protein HY303_03730, partial [Candidatus Wallbacteria bacterium]|nr:hypothetical protein [Candidatus Wallbacteria bacterium]
MMNKRGTRTRLVAAAAAALSLSSTAAAQELASNAGLLDAVNGFVDRLDRVFDYQVAPDFRQNDLYGRRVSLAEYAGRLCIVTFVDQRNEEEARAWLEEQSIDYLGDTDIVFVNVLYPGRIPFIVSRD